MGFLDFQNKELQNLKNEVKALKKDDYNSVLKNISVDQLDRAKAEISQWRDALEQWEDYIQPDRYEMMQLYQEIEQDDTVKTHFETIVKKILAADFEIGMVNDKKEFEHDEEATDKLKKTWFQKFIRFIIDSEMQGYTLMQFPTMDQDSYNEDELQLIPRYLVIPEKKRVRTRAQVDIGSIDYTKKKYGKRLIEVGDIKEKGLYNNIAPLYIYKKNALAYWANYQSKFGIPPVVAKTELSNRNKVNDIAEFLQNLVNNSFSIIGLDDQLEALKGVESDAYQTFKELIDLADLKISKIMEGQTMTSTDGSSRSQAEVHERVSNEFHIARLRMIEYYVNQALFPKMTNDGFNLNEKLIFRYKEIKDIDLIVDRVVKLKKAGYSVNSEYLQNLIGLPIEQVSESTEEMESVYNKIKQIYDGIIE